MAEPKTVILTEADEESLVALLRHSFYCVKCGDCSDTDELENRVEAILVRWGIDIDTLTEKTRPLGA